MPRVAIGAPDVQKFARALATAGADWWIAPIRGEIVGQARWAGRPSRLGRADGAMVLRNLLSPSGVQLTDTELGVEVGFWFIL